MSITRRQLLGSLAAGAGGVAVGAAGMAVVAADDVPPRAPAPAAGLQTEQFDGVHQAGIVTPAQAFAAFTAYDLRAGIDRADLVRLMRLLTDDARRMTAGRAALGDIEPELVASPSRLTVTFGFGPGVFARAGLEDRRPQQLRQLPGFSIDQLEPRWSGGDLLIQVCCDDPVMLSHAERMLWKDTRAFAQQRWAQHGFLPARGSLPAGTTPRNLFGQVDGTVNPSGPQLEDLVWLGEPDSLAGGTYAVIRRIAMHLDTWDAVSRADRELAVGRRLDTGAPLTGSAEHDPPDLNAVDGLGLKVIPEFAHVRRARLVAGPQFLRRGYSYDAGRRTDGTADAGLIFAAYTSDIDGRLIPVQRSLAELDLLNTWTTPIGSAVFAIPPGISGSSDWVGSSLLG